MLPSEVIKDPESWCQCKLFIDANGSSTPFSKDAVKCCMLGAVVKATGLQPTASLEEKIIAPFYEDMLTIIKNVLKTKYPDSSVFLSIPSWNDEPGRTHQEVIEVLKEAEAIYEEQRKLGIIKSDPLN